MGLKRGKLDIGENLRYERWARRAQKITLCALMLIVIAALSGLLEKQAVAVLRALAVYLFLLVVFRGLGKRAMAQITTFDFVLLLIISESTQQALLGEDYSVSGAFVVIATLVLANFAFTVIGDRFNHLRPWLEDAPLVLVDQGTMRHDFMKKLRVSEDDIMESARRYHGLESMRQVKYAIIEKDGSITVIPYQERSA